MPIVRVKVNVSHCVQDSQEYGSTDEHMVSRVFYEISVGDEKKGEFCSDIKQIVGSAYSSENLEVTRPSDYSGPFDHQTFSRQIKDYYLGLVHSSGAMISLGGATNVRMRNNRFQIPSQFEFDAEGPSAGW